MILLSGCTAGWSPGTYLWRMSLNSHAAKIQHTALISGYARRTRKDILEKAGYLEMFILGSRPVRLLFQLAGQSDLSGELPERIDFLLPCVRASLCRHCV